MRDYPDDPADWQTPCEPLGDFSDPRCRDDDSRDPVVPWYLDGYRGYSDTCLCWLNAPPPAPSPPPPPPPAPSPPPPPPPSPPPSDGYGSCSCDVAQCNDPDGYQDSCKVAEDGDLKVVADMLLAGAAYVSRLVDGTWVQEGYLQWPYGGRYAGDSFGYSVAISGNAIVIGAVGDDSCSTEITQGAGPYPVSDGCAWEFDCACDGAGAAYVFSNDTGAGSYGNPWMSVAYLKAPNAAAADQFGWSVAISGDTIVVGAPYEDSCSTEVVNGTMAMVVNGTSPYPSDDNCSQAGAAYVFRDLSKASVERAAPCGGTILDGACFEVYDEARSWTAAEAYCVSHRSHLATITTPVQNEAVRSLCPGHLNG